MPQFDEKHVKINGCFIVWDGITRPDQDQQGNPKYSLKIVTPPNNPDLDLFGQLAVTTLQQSKFRGVLPQGGLMPIGTAGPQEFGGMFPGWGVISAKTKFLPDVYDANGQKLDPMQYGPLLFTGQAVDVLLHCYEYDKAGNKGISAGLDALEPIVAANAVRLDIGGGGIQTAGAFGNGGAPAMGQQQPLQQQPLQGQPQQAMQQPAQQQPLQQQGYQQPAQQQQPEGAGYIAPGQGAGVQPGMQQQPQQGFQQPAQQQPMQQQPVQGQPQQAANFMPGQQQ